MNRLFLKVLLFFFLSIHIFSCWSNPYAPFNFVECDDGNINGKNEKVCKLKKKMTLFTNGFYLLLSTKTDSSAGVTSHTISGIISNPNDNSPYANHNLTVQPNNLSTTTDGNGNYTFSLPAGTYTITIKDSNGNIIGTLTLIVSNGGGVSVSILTGVVKMTANGVTGQPDTVATPTFSVASGTYNSDQSISILCATAGVTIYYTIDNSTPTTSVSGSTLQYSSAISVAGNGTSRTIKAIAVKSGMVNSVVASGSWVIVYDQVATPTFSPSAGTYTIDQSISISTTTLGATIYYTTNGSTPVASETLPTLRYTGAISVSGNGTTTTIKAIAVKTGMANSTEASGTWTINYESIDLWNGIVAYYPFNGNAKDESGVNSNHGTVNGATLTTDKFGTANKAYSFDGVNNYINISNISLADYTITAWINLTVVPTTISPRIVSNACWGCYTGSIDFAIDGLNRLTTIHQKLGQDENRSSSQTLFSANEWKFVVTVYNSANQSSKMYVDSILISSSFPTMRIPNYTSAYPFKIGSVGNPTSAQFMYGKIDNLRIYNRVLNTTEVQSLYKNSNTAPTVGNSGTITTSNITSTSLTLNWTKASDGNASGEYATPQNKLQYKVVQSSSNNINTVDNAETNGTVIQNWTTDINTKIITGLTAGQTYHFNVLVRDEHGNKGLYTTKSETMVVTYTIGGTITGLAASGLVLQNNGGDSLTLSNGSSSFIFSTAITSGSTYSVTIQTQPTGLSCSIFSATGTASANVASVNVRCSSVSEVYSWGTFTDNFNGTVSFSGVSGTFGGNAYTAQNQTWMKCSQGQTWNSNTNNCDGTAGSYQFCSSDNNNCNGGVETNELGVGGFLGGSTSEAYTQCDNLVYGGYSDWRVPNIKELKTLINCTNKMMPNSWPTIPYSCGVGNYNASSWVNDLFPNNGNVNAYWSSTTYIPIIYRVYYVGGSGFVAISFHKTDNNYYLRCVR